MSKFAQLGIKPTIRHYVGDKIAVSKILDKEITIKKYKIEPSKIEGWGDCLYLQIEFKGEQRVVWTGGKYLIQMLEKLPKSEFPLTTKIIEIDEHFEFEN